METALKDLAVEELNGTIVRIEMLNTDMTRVVVWSKTATKPFSRGNRHKPLIRP